MSRETASRYAQSPGMNYPHTTAQAVALVHDAIVSGNATKIESVKNTLEASNSLEGPLC